MRQNERKARDLLAKIKRLLNEELPDTEDADSPDLGHDDETPSCTPKFLPTRLLVAAAETAVRINPLNSPLIGPMAAAGATFAVDDPLKIAVVTAKYWGPETRRLTVSFMEAANNDVKNKILSHLNAWSKTCGISFVLTGGVGQIRISRGGGGFYSYLGTDVLHIPRNRQTMNLEGFTMNTSDSEYKRVVRHEAGHTLGFPHEHMREALVRRIDRHKAFAYFARTSGWDQQTVINQVLTPLDGRTILGTPTDQDSIMCYQLPASITVDGKPIRGGNDINATDYAFAGRIYPKSGAAIPQSATGSSDANWGEEDWPEGDDPDVSV
ncbi:M12 family metallopeptidase [Anatilimnocola sp. NA78]|uniref:M12 family metallopeptidase n=1 Tax=Anatilimnocola sp. NA78 TaxID=3415683 RepID=UPI003CE4B8B4